MIVGEELRSRHLPFGFSFPRSTAKLKGIHPVRQPMWYRGALPPAILESMLKTPTELSRHVTSRVSRQQLYPGSGTCPPMTYRFSPMAAAAKLDLDTDMLGSCVHRFTAGS